MTQQQQIGINLSIDMEKMRKCKIFLATPMYGGSCEGIFAKSISDLTASCAQRGIGLVVHFLMNESLIPRARNYCVDAFMRSDCTHLMFIDADIGFSGDDVLALLAYSIQNEGDNPYDIIGGSYPKKCLHNTTKILTENGTKTINDIVSNKYSGKVLTLSKRGVFEWNKIISHSKEKNNGKKWIEIQAFDWGKNKKIKPANIAIVTDDHEVAYVDNPLDFDVKYTQAKNLVGKWVVQTTNVDTNNPKAKRQPLFSKDQVSAFIGASLGDVHSEEQVEYAIHKSTIFNESLKNKNNKRSFSGINPVSEYLGNLIYDQNRKKTLKNVIHLIDEISLAYLYMNDGNRNERYTYHKDTGLISWSNKQTRKNRRAVESSGENWIRECDDKDQSNCSIDTMGLSAEDNKLLSDHIKKTFGIDSTVVMQKCKDKDYPILKFDRDNAKKFYKLISPYIIPSMEYKIDPEYRNGIKKQIDVDAPVDFTVTKVVNVNPYKNNNNSFLYDIGVENNHNFIINDGLLVHNCISWEKVLVAANKGFGDNNPNELEKFVGDFVFNPLPGTTQIKLNEPAEVLEIGTGFMMARRATFEKFQEAYPDYMYRPDHVRDENFDGKRKIMMFFQSEIDPESERYLSEDYWFMQKARKIGLRTWLCPWMGFGHAGKYIFSGSVYNMAQLGVSATADQSVLDQIKKNKQ